jgi:serine/threonine protein kinase
MPSVDRLTSSPAPHGRPVGPYLMYGLIGAGGLTSVHFGRQRGPGGLCRTVAMRRLPPRLARDLRFLSRLVSDARLLARLRHAHLIPLLDAVVLDSDEVMLVSEYVHGETVASLLGGVWEQGEVVPPEVAVAIVADALAGLEAAHEACDDDGQPLGLVHGDVSPAAFLVGVDGRTHLLDFGVAEVTAAGTDAPAGTLAYLAPEKLQRRGSDRRADLYAAGVVLWEMLTMRRLYAGADEASVATRERALPAPSALHPAVGPELDAVVLAALHPDPRQRLPTARALSRALQTACPPASYRAVSDWVRGVRGPQLDQRARELARIERVSMGELLARSVGDDDDAAARATSLLVVSSEHGSGSHAWISPSEEGVVEEIDLDIREGRPATARAAGADQGNTVVQDAPAAAARLHGAPDFLQEVSSYQVEVVERTGELGPHIEAAHVYLAPPPVRPAAVISQRSSWLVDTAVSAVVAILAVAVAAGARPPAPIPAAVAVPSEPAVCRDRAPVLAAAPPPIVAPADDRAAVLPAPVLPPPHRPPRPRRIPRPAVERMAEIAALNRRALQAYQRADLPGTLRLLSRSMTLASQSGLERHQLSALSHLHMGVLLAGGLHQRDLAIKHFRIALAIRPDIRPIAPVATAEVMAAFRDAVAGAD